jgi:flavin-dependent dehydrogenase
VRDQYDVIVVGGGPAGTTASGLLSKWGRRVLVLEKEKFPRCHIGESLVPGVMPVIEELGATEILAELGAIRKYGLSLLWGETQNPGVSVLMRLVRFPTPMRSSEPSSTTCCWLIPGGWAQP